MFIAHKKGRMLNSQPPTHNMQLFSESILCSTFSISYFSLYFELPKGQTNLRHDRMTLGVGKGGGGDLRWEDINACIGRGSKDIDVFIVQEGKDCYSSFNVVLIVYSQDAC